MRRLADVASRPQADYALHNFVSSITSSARLSIVGGPRAELFLPS